MSRIVIKVFLGHFGYVKDIFNDFRVPKVIFVTIRSSWRLVSQGSMTVRGDLLDSPPRRTENRDFWVQKMKSRYGFRIVTKVFLGHFELFKTTFAVFKVPKRIFLAWSALKERWFWCKSDSLEDLEHSPPWRTENRDFWAQKFKSRYGFRIVTKVVLGHFESFKATFAVSKVPKRNILAWGALKV